MSQGPPSARVLDALPASLAAPAPGEAELWWLDGEVDAALARATWQRVLAAYLGGAAPRLRRTARGRPFLDHAGAPDFNASHTRGGAVLVVAGRGPVGIDLERRDRVLPALRLARRWFAPEEAHALETLAPARAQAAFLQLWTAKEAACKATGRGIAGQLHRWRFEVGADPPRLLAAPERAPGGERWRFQHLHPAPGFVCTLAVAGALPRWRGHYVLRGG